jgi:phosphoribosylanthranilate isomerase
MKIKICGITDIETGIAAASYGADAIGFVFAESKRKVPIEDAKKIALNLPKNVWKVGVFVNESKDEIERVASIVGLTHIQLHGEETAIFSRSLSLPVIKAWSIEKKENSNELKEYPCDYILLDGPKGKYSGGNGTVFKWSTIDPNEFNSRKLILAGGLTIENVEEGIRTIKPYMVDVSSGVETEGKKDLKKVRLFIDKAKGSLNEGEQTNDHIQFTK